MQATHTPLVPPAQLDAVSRIHLAITVDPVTLCWVSSLSPNADGYSTVNLNGRSYLSHRVMHATFSGLDVTTLDPEKLVLHGCDNPPCVNPRHLRFGTTADNIADKVARGRADNGRSRITHCRRGHRLVEPNLVLGALRDGRRACLICNRARSAVVAARGRGEHLTLEDAITRELCRTDKGRDLVAAVALSPMES